MKREFLSTALAFILAFGIFALNHVFHSQDNKAEAAIYSNSALANLNKPYTESYRRKISNRISYSSDRILRLSGRDIYEVLDQPELVRRDLPTVVWQYRSNECVLDIYFTASGDDVLASPVVHYEMRARKKGIAADTIKRDCVASLIKSRDNFTVLDAQAFYKSSL